MTKKERTIRACRELAEKYREPVGRTLFRSSHCSLCQIHLFPKRQECKGCPLARKSFSHYGGCMDFDSGRKARDSDLLIKELEPRAAFFDKIIPILEGIPASRFTKRGWKYFDMLDRRW